MKWLLFFYSSALMAGSFEHEIILQRAWNSANHPRIFFQHYESRFQNMAKSRRDQKIGWSDDYWPRFQGGIAFRWQSYQSAHEYRLFSRKEILKLTPQHINKLSPTEKWDIAHQDYDYSLTKKVMRQNPASAPGWQGICDGWAEANLHQMAPRQKTIETADGLKIQFYPSDIAAILSFYYAKEKTGKVYFLGRRCRGSSSSDMKCQDVNPGAFHIVLNQSFKSGRGIIADIDPGPAVWNHPIKSYQVKVLAQRDPTPTAAQGSTREILIENKLKYLVETNPSRSPHKELLADLTLHYWLELDSDGQILGGSWSKKTGLDFLWFRGVAKLPPKYQFLL